MTNEEIKEKLKSLYDCKVDFIVTQSGKESEKVNGLYKTESHEIILHKNFNTTNELMYTAIHEFTHHVIVAEMNIKGARCHTNLFWKTYYDFLDKATEAGLYSRTRCQETTNLIETAKNIQQSIVEAQSRLGEIIERLCKSCERNNERIEDVIEHDLQITRNKAKDLQKLHENRNAGNDELAKIINSAKNEDLKKEAVRAAAEGKTVAQVKAIAQNKKDENEDVKGPERLVKEKKRLEKTIEALTERLETVEEALSSLDQSIPGAGS